MNKSILVPTDFSNNAGHALDYAIMLAKKQKTGIILLHAYSIVYVSPEVPLTIIAEEIAAVKEVALKRLEVLSARVEQNNVKCEILNKQGSAVSLISETIKKRRPSMVIMGTNGASGIREAVVGSNTASVIAKTKCPVIAVPKKPSLSAIKNIIYAADYHSRDLKAIEKLTEIGKLFNARITIIHVPEGDFFQDKEEERLSKYVEKVRGKVNYRKLGFKLVYGKRTINTLKNYADSESPDLFAMTAHQHNLRERILKPSTTRKMVYHTKIPLLVLH